MPRATAVALAALLVACSNDTFVSEGDAAADVSGEDQASEAAPPPDAAPPTEASTGDGSCGAAAAAPCATGCTSPGTCCVKGGTKPFCTAIDTCVGGESIACSSSDDCTNGADCCIENVTTIGGCPPTAQSSGSNSLMTVCTNNCTGKLVCKTSGDCKGNGQCDPVVLDINPSYGLHVCR